MTTTRTRNASMAALKRLGLAALGARIRAAREAAEMTQADLGRACGVAPNTIARIERGEQEPASLLLGVIAQALSVSSDHLLGLDA